MSTPAQRSDPTVLLRTDHAVARVLADAPGEGEAYPRLLAAIGEAQGWDAAAVWEPEEESPELRCTAAWPSDELPPGGGLRERAWAEDRPVWDEGGVAVPIPGVGVMELFSADPPECDEDMLATLAGLGSQIGQFTERCRALQAVHESEARKTAILDAAFDCVIMMDHEGRVLEVNEPALRTFGYTAAEMVGHELAELIIPPGLREAHRHGVERYLATGAGHVLGHPVDLTGMRADGSEFPVEVAITRPDIPGPPLFCGYLRDVSDRREGEHALRVLAEEQAALRRVATAVATETDPRRVFGVVTEEVARLLDAQSANMVRYGGDGTATVVGGWSSGAVRNMPVGEVIRLDGDTAASRVWRGRGPARMDSYEYATGSLAEMLRGLGFRSAVAAPVVLSGRLWGAVIVSSVYPEPFPEGAEQRIADFAALAAQALANAQAREELAASRARIVEAGDAERKRLERNLHDGAQQRLVSLSLGLRMAARRFDGEAGEEFERAGEELAQALDELRELARGIHPAILSQRGLGPAIEALATRASLPVALDVGLEERLPEPVEAAAYYVVAEALTNAAKYARASEVRVRVARADGVARIEVADDGVGGAGRELGGGLRGLTDRVEALGGRLELDSPVGAGTRVRAEIPAGGR
jgi:PAS domain S-box-containing protein